MNVTLKQLRYFVALAEEGSFGGAAARVNISQPAVSLQIKELESACGHVLIDRAPRKLTLTRAGQLMLDHAHRVLAEVNDLEQALRWQDGLSGKLNLGIIPTVAPYLLPQALTRLRSADLTLDIRVREAQTDVLLKELLAGRLDAAVMALPIAAAGVATHVMFQDHFLLAGSVDRLAHLDAQGGLMSPTELNPTQLLLLDEGHCLADQALEVCGLQGRRPAVDLGASSLNTLCGLVAEGFGLTLLPELAQPTEQAAAPGLALRRFNAPQPHREIALCVRSQNQSGGWVFDLTSLLQDAGRALLANVDV